MERGAGGCKQVAQGQGRMGEGGGGGLSLEAGGEGGRVVAEQVPADGHGAGAEEAERQHEQEQDLYDGLAAPRHRHQPLVLHRAAPAVELPCLPHRRAHTCL